MSGEVITEVSATVPGEHAAEVPVLADGDYVTDHWTATLTHKGEFLGIPATCKTVQLTGIDISRVVDGKVTETWHQEDIAGLTRQLTGAD